MSHTVRFQIILLFLCCLCPVLLVAQLPEGFHEQVYAEGFDQPMGVTFDHLGRMLVWEKAGRVWIVDTTGQRLPEPLLDIREEVSNWKDHGLLGFTLDVDYEVNGRFYLLYSLDLHHYEFYGTPAYDPDQTVDFEPTIGRVARYTADPGSGFTKTKPESRKILLGKTLENGIPLLYEFHGLGSILAADDGTLLISTGDATSNHGADIGGDSLGTFVSRALERGIITPDEDLGSYKAQYLGSYSGKILRIDAETGDGLPSNPFYDPANPRSPQSRTWAYGFRNPYRIALWPHTGSHYASDAQPGVILAGDVGNGLYEELDIIKRGGQNFGWPIWEGVGINTSFYALDAPLNPLAPNPLYGQDGCDQPYFDFRQLLGFPVPEGEPRFQNPCNGAREIPASAHPREISLPAITWSNSRWNPPTRALLMIPNDENDGYRTIHIDDPASPIQGEPFDGYSALAGVVYEAGPFPEAYHGKFFAIDYSGWIKLMTFDENYQLQAIEPFYDGAANIHHMALNPRDGALYFLNLTDEIRRISYGGNAPPTAVIEADRLYGPGPLTVQFDGAASFDDDQPIIRYEWDFGDGTTSSELNPRHTFQTSGSQVKSYRVRLTVTDSLGASHTAAATVSLNNTPPDVRISSFEDGDQFFLKQTVPLMLAANVADAEHPDNELQYEWNVYLHHNSHYHPEPTNYDHRTFTLVSPIGCDDQTYWYRITLKVTDPGGLSATDSREIFPFCGEEFANFIDLTARRTSDHIELNWQALISKEIEYFEVQRGAGLFDFETIATVPVRAWEGAYQFVDGKPYEGANTYRIKVRTADQAFTYSPIATAVFVNSNNLQVFPNPANDYFNLRIQSANGGLARLELFTMSGQPVIHTAWETTPNQPFSQEVSTHYLDNGTYFYRLTNGDEEKVGKLIIMH